MISLSHAITISPNARLFCLYLLPGAFSFGGLARCSISWSNIPPLKTLYSGTRPTATQTPPYLSPPHPLSALRMWPLRLTGRCVCVCGEPLACVQPPLLSDIAAKSSTGEREVGSFTGIVRCNSRRYHQMMPNRRYPQILR